MNKTKNNKFTLELGLVKGIKEPSGKAKLSALLKDEKGNYVEGKTITFTVEKGRGGFETNRDEYGADIVENLDVKTDSVGLATVTYHTVYQPETAKIKAQYAEKSETITISSEN